MSDVLLLEAGRRGPFWFRHNGEVHPLPDPADMGFQLVLQHLHDEVPPTGILMNPWKATRLFEAWMAHYDLPDYQSANRLTYLVDHYRAPLTFDLQAMGVDLGDYWRGRRWRTLLDIIDRLPAHAWYNAAVANDEEHAKLVREWVATHPPAEGDGADAGPALQTWTPEVAALTNLTDAVNQVRHAIIAVNSERGKAPEAPKPMPRPSTPFERAVKAARYDHRKSQHESLARRMLPHKYEEEPPE